MRLEKLATEYGVEIKVEEMKAIFCYDAGCGTERFLGPSLCGRLGEIEGVSRINYDGHFGPTVFFTVEVGTDTYTKHRRIKAVLKKHILACQKAVAGK